MRPCIRLCHLCTSGFVMLYKALCPMFAWNVPIFVDFEYSKNHSGIRGTSGSCRWTISYECSSSSCLTRFFCDTDSDKRAIDPWYFMGMQWPILLNVISVGIFSGDEHGATILTKWPAFVSSFDNCDMCEFTPPGCEKS